MNLPVASVYFNRLFMLVAFVCKGWGEKTILWINLM